MVDPAHPEAQLQDTYGDGVDLVRLISNEFGTSPAVVKSQLQLGDIYIDDVKWNGDDHLFIPQEIVLGKEIKVIGPERRWRLDYKE